MQRPALFAALLLGLTVAAAALAAEFEDYPQFRYMSGLPGSGYGVEEDGSVGFNGALQMNIPVAYTLSSGNYALAGHSSAVNGGLALGLSGDDVNGTLTIGIGLGPAEGGLYCGVMNTGSAHWGEPAYNLQWQVLAETEQHPAVAIGVVDLLNMRPARLSHIFDGGGCSLYAVATRRFGDEEHPAFWTVGLGDGRFHNRLFGGVSYQLADRLKLAGEYDGWDLNAGAAWDAWTNEQWHGVVLLGLTDLSRITVGATLTRTSK